jgi:hypothetical protein
MDRIGLHGSIDFRRGGNLNGQRATTHWYKMGVLRIMSAKPRQDERLVRSRA